MENDRKTEIENQEWVDSINWIIEHDSPGRARELAQLINEVLFGDGERPKSNFAKSDYVNSIPSDAQHEYPGDLEIEERIQQAVRWNAMAIVANANEKREGIGGHISTYSSASRLFEVGFHHFFRGYDQGRPDIVMFQGHASPGLYARSFLEHRLDEEQLHQFRAEVSPGGLPSYPHPRSLSAYWRYPTVSMGLAPIQAIYQARFIKYLENRGLIEQSDQKVWAFVGDGEMDEPESTGALSIASREKLDNLIFVVNCNLQRLDGPVRGNSKVITELERIFMGAGWKVIKVLWGEGWTELFERDSEGALMKLVNEIPDGQLQHWAQYDVTELREKVFGQRESLKNMVEDISDEKLARLEPGGHDPVKVFNAFKQATENKEGPTVVLAQTVKGYRQGDAGEASNVTHQRKVFKVEELKSFRDELELDFDDSQLEDDIPFFRFEKDSGEYKYLVERRRKLNGWLPHRKNLAKKFPVPPDKLFSAYYKGSDEKPATTTGAFIQILSKLLKDKSLGRYIVPIIPDESRTFGLDALFKQAGIYASKGQLYEPVDEGSLLYYNESKEGTIIEEGITEAGSMATFMAAGTNHIVRDFYTVPFFMFYSMFGFQRIGDLIWAAADARARGFLIGGISGRTSLSGEGLQHADGQSHLYALAYPSLRAYDPAFAFEVAIILQEGLRRMYVEHEDIMYYVTLTNQSYPMPALPEGAKDGVLKGLYPFRLSRKRKSKKQKVNLLSSGAIMIEAQRAAALLEQKFDIPVNLWSVTSYKALYDEACAADESRISGKGTGKSYVQKSLEKHGGQVFVAASDYVRALPLSISKWVPGSYTVLGTDGFGKSDTVPELRRFFRVDAMAIAKSAITSLVALGLMDKQALKKLDESLKEEVNELKG